MVQYQLPTRPLSALERTFAWLGRCCRLSKDYEYLRVCSENAIYLTMAMLLVRRLARPARRQAFQTPSNYGKADELSCNREIEIIAGINQSTLKTPSIPLSDAPCSH